MNTRKMWLLFLALCVFELVDFTATAHEVRMWGIDSEANPAMAGVIVHHSMWAVGVIKVICLSFLAALFLILGGERLGATARRLFVVTVGVFGAVTLYHGLILVSTHSF
jgi:hypothetical protein